MFYYIFDILWNGNKKRKHVYNSISSLKLLVKAFKEAEARRKRVS